LSRVDNASRWIGKTQLRHIVVNAEQLPSLKKFLTLIKFLKMENSRKRKLPSVKVILVDKMPDYSNDPAVLRKEKIVRAFIEKNGLPHGARKNKGK
jgi:hypothetical protein